MNKIIITAIAIIIFGSGHLLSAANKNEDVRNVEQNLQVKKIKMKLYKSATCNCCELYAGEMKKQGYDVEVIPTDDMNAVKEKYNIPYDRQSCHTTIVDDYYIEGHVPMEAVKKLLDERPAIDGIGLPGMPIGTPGMPGEKTAPYEIYQSVDGKFLKYLTI
jgi:hypothetical protein